MNRKQTYQIIFILFIIFLNSICSFSQYRDSLSGTVAIFDSTARVALANEKPLLHFEAKITELLNDSSRWVKKSKELTLSDLEKYNEIYLIQKLPNRKFRNPAILISYHTIGYQLYIDSHLVYSSGNLAISTDSAYRYFNSDIIPIDTGYQNKYLVVRAHYNQVLQLGNIYNFTLGSTDSIAKVYTNISYKQLTSNLHETVAAIIQIVIGIITILIFLLRWKNREYSLIFFGIFAISSGIMNISDFTEQFLNISFTSLFYLNLISSFLVPVGFLGFVKFITNSNNKSVINYAFWTSILITSAVAWIPLGFAWNYLFWGIAYIGIFIAIRALIINKFHKNRSFRIPLIALIIFVLSVIHDCLLLFGLPSAPFGLYNWAMLLLIIAFGYYLEQHYRDTYNKVKNYSLELEKTRSHLLNLEKENLATQYQVLINQVNPHFLFNSLNTLSSLIRSNPKDAVRFVEEFADLYRYVLDVHDKFVVEIQKELDFIQSYIYLQKIRYGENLNINISISAERLNDFVMPLTLQILIENAIKHNEISDRYPLNIEVFSKDDFIIVSNDLRYVESSYSKGIGLKNLKERYAGITNVLPEFLTQNGKYVARIPIIKEE